MAKVFFDNPMNLTGTSEEKLRQVYSYLFTMSEKLNEALNTITVEQMEPEVRTVLTKAGGAEEKTQSNISALKAMIIKTANIVRSEMDEIGTQLHGEYEAISEDFGTLQETMDARISANAQGITQNYDYFLNITSGLEEFQEHTSDYIFTGIIDPSTNTVGVAIGENVTQTDAQGNESLNTTGRMAIFTKDELAFYNDGYNPNNKMAWFANNTFYISTGNINNSLQMGNNHRWQINSDGSLALMALTARP